MTSKCHLKCHFNHPFALVSASRGGGIARGAAGSFLSWPAFTGWSFALAMSPGYLLLINLELNLPLADSVNCCTSMVGGVVAVFSLCWSIDSQRLLHTHQCR